MREYMMGSYDVAVIGAGHAGCEAALAAARFICPTMVERGVVGADIIRPPSPPIDNKI